MQSFYDLSQKLYDLSSLLKRLSVILYINFYKNKYYE